MIARLYTNLYEEILDQKDRLLLWSPVLLALGVGFYFSLRFEPSFVLVGAVWLVIAGGFALLTIIRNGNGFLRGVWLAGMGLFIIVTGFGAAQWRAITLDSPLMDRKIGPVMIEGVISDIDAFEPGAGSRLIIDPLSIEHMKSEDMPRHIRLKVHYDEGLRVGKKIRVLAGLNPPSAPVAPGGFDFQRFAYFKQIGAFGFAYQAPEILEERAQSGFWARVDGLRHAMIARIDAQMDYPAAAFAAALMTGERAAITKGDWQAIRAAGLAHMLAISGLHVGIVAGLLFFILRFAMACWPWLALHCPIKKYAAFGALLGAAGYTILAGAGVPTVRALFMTGIILIAVMLDRQAFSLRTVALAGFVILLFLPESLFSVSFQMSFAAVTALVFVYEQIKPWWSALYRGGGWLRRAFMYFAGVVLTTLVAGSAVAPFSLYHFQQYPLYDIPANILAAPLMSFLIMPGVVLTFFTMPLGLEGLSLKPLEWGIDGLLTIARHVEALPNATWNPPAWPAAALLCFVTAGLWFVLWQGHLRFAAGFLVICGLMIIINYKQPDILIASSAKLIALRSDGPQMHLSSKVHDRFSAENWARLWGVKEEAVRRFPKEGEGKTAALRCGEWGCHMEKSGKAIAFSTHPQGLAEDCGWADIVIAQDPVRDASCGTGTVIDIFDLHRDGAMALWLPNAPESVRVESVASLRGVRPWVINNRR